MVSDLFLCCNFNLRSLQVVYTKFGYLAVTPKVPSQISMDNATVHTIYASIPNVHSNAFCQLFND